MVKDDEVFENGWHTGLGFPLKPMVLLEGCNPSRPEYYRAVVVRHSTAQHSCMFCFVQHQQPQQQQPSSLSPAAPPW